MRRVCPHAGSFSVCGLLPRFEARCLTVKLVRADTFVRRDGRVVRSNQTPQRAHEGQHGRA
eukprot:2361227-Prymnesium_polylepis.1